MRHTAIVQISFLKNQISHVLNKFLSDQGTEPSNAAYRSYTLLISGLALHVGMHPTEEISGPFFNHLLLELKILARYACPALPSVTLMKGRPPAMKLQHEWIRGCRGKEEALPS